MPERAKKSFINIFTVACMICTFTLFLHLDSPVSVLSRESLIKITIIHSSDSDRKSTLSNNNTTARHTCLVICFYFVLILFSYQIIQLQIGFQIAH